MWLFDALLILGLFYFFCRNMPEELADCSEKGKSYIVVLPQTLVQFNAILVETTLSADDQLQQFFQIYQW